MLVLSSFVNFSTIFCISLCILTLFFTSFFFSYFSPSPFPSSHCSFFVLETLFSFAIWLHAPYVSLYSSDLYEQLHHPTSSHNHTHTLQHVFKHTNTNLSLFYPPHSLPSLSAPNPLTIFMIQPSFFAISRGTASLPRIC